MDPDTTALLKKQYQDVLGKTLTLTGRLSDIESAKQQVMPEMLKRVSLDNRAPLEDPSTRMRALTSIQGSPYTQNVDSLKLQMDVLNNLKEQLTVSKETDSLSQKELQKMYADGNSRVKYNPETKMLELSYGDMPNDFNSEQAKEAATKLRTEYTNQSKTNGFVEVKNQYDKIKNASDSAQGDLSLIFAYMKILDPNSTVREGEFANAQNTTGIPGQVLNAYNKVRKGNRLNAEQRIGFKNEAAQVYNSHARTQKQMYDFYKNQAEEYGVDPEDVVGMFGDIKEEKVSAKQEKSGSLFNYLFGNKQSGGQPNQIGRFTVEVE